ncbi:probable LRR receptor-like serine/threonine-protein kinase At3g47570 [Pistacia vera]|uniref:probable LRR receptor-like serine/threonine-protein kinase At3g47570 n=1 Tax=Pistacia vera TaxID=55513 RepID=UPI001262F113|nr:probable LRR receptor-like serine/threonine-protein kinase At3g47570 [Pistacia vera]
MMHVTNLATTRELAGKAMDLVALQSFKLKIIHDPHGVLNSWNDSHHFCEWEGITCGRKHRRVTVLALNSRGLFGSLTPYIGNLSFLRDIELYNNSIQGEIPNEIGRLQRLESLMLQNNSLVGEIPANLSRCSRLAFLYLGRNNLAGKIPSELVSLYNLKEVTLHYNKLIGGIPPFLGNLSSLEVISMSYIGLGGIIPDSLGRLKNLTQLGLGGNNLFGPVPPSMYNLSSLEIFSLSESQLHGSLPTNLGLTLPQLLYFQISGNLFSGSIPVSFSNASKLQFIEMISNNFSGKLSVDFGGMKDLAYLNVGMNNLGSSEGDEMSFIDSLVNCSNLWSLTLAENQFRGALPHSLANLSKLQDLVIHANQLYGSIPPGIGNLVNLDILAMDNNQFTGTLPEEMGKLLKLQRMILFNNQLSGQVPSSLGNLTLLNELRISNKKLSGVLPSSLGNLKQLSVLHLFQNNLNGTIPKEIFDITYLSISLNLAQNHLVGSILPNIGNLKVLSEFDVSDNNLSGEIPSELSLCSNLEYLKMESNFFHGSIPPSLSSLRGVRNIDLSRNNLSGKIPKFLEVLSLENLNLSFNDLEGEVPMKGVFANASAISVFGNSDRLCGGTAELHLPKCINDVSKKENMSPTFKILISIATVISGLVMVLFFIFCLRRKKRENQNSESEPKTLLKVSYEMLHNATNGFSSTNLIGVGSFGSVFKGIIDEDGTIVAIKILNLQHRGASKSFVAECKALRNIRHRNLVKVITCCSSIDFQGIDFKAIVYEYMPNGSLDKWLHQGAETEEEQAEVQNLTLVQRISIAIDVASAIDYLHHRCHMPIIHCDLKPSNVLLDNDMTAHVGDFGLARFLQEVSIPNQSSSIGVRGTIGYAAPEYGLGSEVSTNGDVYSYGILMLEMITGKRPTDLMFEGGLNLHKFARMALPDRVMDIADPVLLNDDEEASATNHRLRATRDKSRKDCLNSMAKIGVACSMESPQDRMNITDAVHELQLVMNILLEHRTLFNRLTAFASSSSLITRELAQNETGLAALQAFKSKIIHDIDFCTIL